MVLRKGHLGPRFLSERCNAKVRGRPTQRAWHILENVQHPIKAGGERP